MGLGMPVVQSNGLTAGADGPIQVVQVKTGDAQAGLDLGILAVAVERLQKRCFGFPPVAREHISMPQATMGQTKARLNADGDFERADRLAHLSKSQISEAKTTMS